MASIPIFSQLRGGRFNHRLSEVEPTTPAAPAKERDRLFDGAATPPFQGGEWAFPTTAILDPVSSGRLVGNAHPWKGGVAAASIIRREATEAPQTGWSVRRNLQA